MRRTTLRRTAVAATAVSLALLVSACGSKKEDSSAKDQPKAKASSAAPAADGKALSKAELDKLVLTQADLQGHKVAEATEADLAATKSVSSDKAECKPLVDAMMMHGAGTPAATATRKIAAVPQAPAADASAEEKMKAGLGALSATVTADTLGTHDGQGATEAVAGLKKAGTACAGGFTLTAGGEKTKITKVEPASYTAGDEAVAFTLTVDLEGQSGTAHMVAVRKGTTVATFYSQSLAGKAEQPKAVIDAQMKKLG
ncbi:hypothetical protein LE181_07605 [Streptomyces sp. SCA3-4]|uniref:hypothetical protein n=1 Tax=Streptomyces sichuanensis TaxID=2871810 RepID=UPI001CE281F4|nr:hypothetical protein [Streptomyces sichuanensis]MCA6092027.1 hypothetical protein [Streptomyces sichuanensis]